MKKVLKYGTGQLIPKNAKYLCTKVEWQKKKSKHLGAEETVFKENAYVWHYYEVEAAE